MKKRILIAALGFVALLAITGLLRLRSSPKTPETTVSEVHNLFEDIPRKGTVTMLDLGAELCLPCKMMAPIMVKLEK